MAKANAKATLSDVVEHATLSGKEKITLTESEGRIRGVKLLGLVSKNGREYTPAAAKKAVSLFEGVRVNIDHPTEPGQPAEFARRFGKAVNVSFVEGDGIRGDVEFNPHHKHAKAFAWYAEHMPDAVGFSPNMRVSARRGTGSDGKTVEIIESINLVRAAEIVADPATTKGVFESAGADPDPDEPVVETDETGSGKGKKRMDPKDITLDMLEQRTDLLTALAEKAGTAKKIADLTEQVKTLTQENDKYKAAAALATRRAAIAKKVEDAKLPKELVTATFMESLESVDETKVDALIKDRMEMAKRVPSNSGAPRSREQSVAESTGRESGSSGSSGRLTLAGFLGREPRRAAR